MTEAEIKSVGYEYGDLATYTDKYFPDGTASKDLKDGFFEVNPNSNPNLTISLDCLWTA